jgi:branched-chain amino acid transport system permease protein
MIRDHEAAAPALGIAVTRSKMTVFALSSVVIGIEGGLTAYLTGSVIADNFTLILAVSYIAMVVIGGLDSIAGAVIGAAIITALPTVVPKIVSHVIGVQSAAQKGASISQIIYGLLLVVFVTSSPRGIVGWFRGRIQPAAQPGRRWAFGWRPSAQPAPEGLPPSNDPGTQTSLSNTPSEGPIRKESNA